MIIEEKLKSGIRIVMEEIPYVQSAALGIWVKAGSVNESKENLGISHFIEHMLFKGTENRSAKKIAEDIDRIGGQINAFTSKEATCYYVKALSSNLEKAADVLIDMLTASKFDPIEMEKEKTVVYEEINMVEDSPEDDAHDTLYEVVFQEKPLATPILGYKETLKNMTDNDLRQYIANQYTCDSIVIAIAGNFDKEKILKLFEDKFNAFQAVQENKKPYKDTYSPIYRVKTKDIEQSHLCLGVNTFGQSDKRYYAMALLNNIMGGSMSSRLFQSIREEKGMAYSVYSYNSIYSNEGFYGIYAGVSHDKVQDTLNAIKEEFDSLQKSGITKEELDMAKEQYKGHYIFSQENVNSRMAALGKNILTLNKYYTAEEIIDFVDKVTMDDMDHLIKVISNLDAYSAVLVTKNDADLERMFKS